MRKHHWLILTALAGAVPALVAAATVDEKGFIFASGDRPLLRKEPKAGAADNAAPANGARLVYKKVVREGDAVEWYFVEQPGVGTGWLAASDASKTRPTALPQVKPPARAPKPGAAAATAATGGSKAPARSAIAEIAAGQTAAGRTLEARALEARALTAASDATKIVEKALIDYLTLERMIGIQMSDPPHPDGRYADVTARGRKADAEGFAKTVAEGD